MITTIIAFLIVLGITITIHEFGHFAMAKLLKIRVLVFSLGFGPRLAGFTRGGTEYRLSPFPIGGYVKMAGETYEDDRKGDPDEFLSRPKWQRFLVAVAGPFMNILLAVFILTFSYLGGVQVARYPKEAAVVGPVSANSIARRAGLQTGDRIVGVQGNSVTTWEDMEVALGTAPRSGLDIEVLRGGQAVSLHFEAPPGNDPVEPALLGFRYSLDKAIVAGVDSGSPAHKAGLKAGDEILSVSGNAGTVTGYNQILNLISESKGVPLRFTVRRPDAGASREHAWDAASTGGGTVLQLDITPIEEGGRVIIGFLHDTPSDLLKLGILGAIGQSVRRNYELSSWTFKIIGRIIRGSASMRTLSGPIEIARISGSAARTGSARVFFGFLGLVSLQLGVFNLLPIPILDGGVILLLLIEGLIGRDLSIRLKERIVQVGFVFLILLMGFVVLNDLSKVVDVNRLFR